MNIKDKSEYKNILDTLSYFFIIVFLVRFAGEISIGNDYNFDIDHEMYFGSRLLNGELLYTNELNDKLPFVQFIFAIPAYFKNVGIWIFFSTLLSLTASLSLFKSLNNLLILYFPNLKKIDLLSISKITSCFYLFSISTTHGSLGMINHCAASSCLLTLCLSINCYTQKNKFSRIRNIILSAFFGAMSISIRPYYIAPIILISIWLFIKNFLINSGYSTNLNNYLKKLKLRKNLLILIIWLILLTSFGFLINVAPYLPNNIIFLIDGILHNSNSLQTQSINTIIFRQLHALPYGSITFVISSITLIFSAIVSFSYIKDNFRKSKNKTNAFKIDILFVGFLAPLLLELMILTKHFYEHYFQLFIPFIAFSFAFLLTYLRENFSIKIYTKKINKAILNFFLVIIIVFSSNEVKTSFGSLQNFFQDSQRQLELNQISKYLIQKKETISNLDFLHLTNMHLHWNLNESRHGFPHASNIQHIYANYWKDLKREYILSIPKDKKQVCNMINNSDIEIIFTDKNSNVYNECLLDKNSKFKLDQTFLVNFNRINAFIKYR